MPTEREKTERQSEQRYEPPAAARLVESPDAELAISGYAQVLVVLAPSAAAPADFAFGTVSGRTRMRASALATASTRAVATPAAQDVKAIASTLEPFFVTPPNSQDVALAQARMISAARKGVRAARATGALEGSALARLTSTVTAQLPKVRTYENLGVLLGTVDQDGLRRLRANPQVHEVHAAAQLSLIRPTRVSPAKKKNVTVTWGLELLGIPQLWAAGLTGEGMIIGHLDTGVDESHRALRDSVASFAEFDYLGEEVVGAKSHDSDQHGTHTAGTLGGRRVGSSRFGVAPDARLASAIVIEGGNIFARILAGMNWIVGQGARVLNMSLGIRGYHPNFLAVTRVLRARGVLPVFAVGNEGAGTSRSPGNYSEALSIGACDRNSVVADISCSQTFARPADPIVPDVVGPGVDVFSCVPGDQYALMSGTSMATPHIAGLAALLMQASDGASIDEIEKAIIQSAALAPGMLPDRANHGLPNGPRAYEALTGSQPAPRPGPSKPKRPTTRKRDKKSGKGRQKSPAKRGGSRTVPAREGRKRPRRR